MALFTAFQWSVVIMASFCFGNGCARLPDVATVIADAPLAQKPRQILSAHGLLTIEKSTALMERLQHAVDPTDILGRHTVVVESVTDSPLTKGNAVTLLADGHATYAAMFRALEHAKDHIHLESYIIEDDTIGRSFADLLVKKLSQGVQVAVMYDSVGSMNTPAAFFQRLRDAGAQVVEFNPLDPMQSRKDWVLSQRDHRKILLVDGRIAILGGVNISAVYSSRIFKRTKNKPAPIHWRDTDVQLEGPAVAELQKLFLDTWQKQQGPPLADRNFFPAGKEPGTALVRIVGSTPGETNRLPFIIYVSAIVFAKRSIHLTNSYFIPDEQILQALSDAAERGVDVKIILPGTTDSLLALHAQRYHYARLMQSGVKIYEHKTSLLHAKTAVIDGVWSTVGSTNLDFLSLLHNDEVNAIILSDRFAGEMEEMFLKDLQNSRQIQRDAWNKRSWLRKLREWFVNVFVRWL